MSGYYRTVSDVVLMGSPQDYLVTRCFIVVGPRYLPAILPRTGGKNHEKQGGKNHEKRFESGVAGWAGAIGDRCASLGHPGRHPGHLWGQHFPRDRADDLVPAAY